MTTLYPSKTESVPQFWIKIPSIYRHFRKTCSSTIYVFSQNSSKYTLTSLFPTSVLQFRLLLLLDTHFPSLSLSYVPHLYCLQCFLLESDTDRPKLPCLSYSLGPTEGSKLGLTDTFITQENVFLPVRFPSGRHQFLVKVTSVQRKLHRHLLESSPSNIYVSTDTFKVLP